MSKSTTQEIGERAGQLVVRLVEIREKLVTDLREVGGSIQNLEDTVQMLLDTRRARPMAGEEESTDLLMGNWDDINEAGINTLLRGREYGDLDSAIEALKNIVEGNCK